MLAPASLAELVETAAARWSPVADREWTVDIRADGTVLVDRGRIDAALDALIENALKATSDGDAIALGAEDHGGVPVISVADRGIGVGLEHRERIFERFARIRLPGGPARGGTGLGLPTVRAIAVAHGGAAELVADPDGWTRFELRLERFEPQDGARTPAPARAPRSLSR
jgi:signal transduction histidine kinase